VSLGRWRRRRSLGYRIVQEALTNVRRHAGPARPASSCEFADRLIRLSVVDDGRGAGSDEGDGSAAGHGLVGIRERAAMLGGTVEAGPRPGAGTRWSSPSPWPVVSIRVVVADDQPSSAPGSP
jgi:signal transduction histidine kinase